MADRYFIRLGKVCGQGLYVRSYAGGDITTTFNRWAALYWEDRDTVLRLIEAIREVDGRHARATVKRGHGPMTTTAWIWAFEDTTGRWFRHQGQGGCYSTRDKSKATHFATKWEAQRSLRQHRKAWGEVGRRHVLIKLTVTKSPLKKSTDNG